MLLVTTTRAVHLDKMLLRGVGGVPSALGNDPLHAAEQLLVRVHYLHDLAHILPAPSQGVCLQGFMLLAGHLAVQELSVNLTRRQELYWAAQVFLTYTLKQPEIRC